MDRARVVSPEISSGKFPPENFRKFIPIFPEIFTEKFSTSINLANRFIFAYIFTFYRLLQQLCGLQ